MFTGLHSNQSIIMVTQLRNIMHLTILAIFFGLFPILVHAQKNDEKAIRSVLEKQTQAWNKGNIDEFMHGYWQSDQLVFISKNGPKYGYAATLENYKKNYPGKAEMGILNFDSLQLKKLSFEYYYVSGKFHLQRTIGNLQGYFTLLFRKIKNNWVIISDHTS